MSSHLSLRTGLSRGRPWIIRTSGPVSVSSWVPHKTEYSITRSSLLCLCQTLQRQIMGADTGSTVNVSVCTQPYFSVLMCSIRTLTPSGWIDATFKWKEASALGAKINEISFSFLPQTNWVWEKLSVTRRNRSFKGYGVWRKGSGPLVRRWRNDRVRWKALFLVWTEQGGEECVLLMTISGSLTSHLQCFAIQTTNTHFHTEKRQ